jgi:hypothetical protein
MFNPVLPVIFSTLQIILNLNKKSTAAAATMFIFVVTCHLVRSEPAASKFYPKPEPLKMVCLPTLNESGYLAKKKYLVKIIFVRPLVSL